MTADHLNDIDQFGADLWKMADDLRANSGLASNEYFMPIMGLLFLRQATNLYYEALAEIEADRAAGRMPDRPLVDADFTRRRAMLLPEAARYDVILDQPKDGKLGAAFTRAMEPVEEHSPPLKGQLRASRPRPAIRTRWPRRGLNCRTVSLRCRRTSRPSRARSRGARRLVGRRR